MASIQTLGVVTLVIVACAVMGAFGVKIISDIGALVNNTQAQEVTNRGVTAINTLFQWLPMLAMVIIAVIIIALLVKGFPLGGGE